MLGLSIQLRRGLDTKDSPIHVSGFGGANYRVRLAIVVTEPTRFHIDRASTLVDGARIAPAKDP